MTFLIITFILGHFVLKLSYLLSIEKVTIVHGTYMIYSKN